VHKCHLALGIPLITYLQLQITRGHLFRARARFDNRDLSLSLSLQSPASELIHRFAALVRFGYLVPSKPASGTSIE